MLLKKEDTSKELHTNSKMLVNMCCAPLATDSHQPMHATFAHNLYIILILILLLYSIVSYRYGTGQ